MSSDKDKSLQARLLQRITTHLQRETTISPVDRIIVGLSTGSDSMALIHLLHFLPIPFTLIGVYVDHKIRPDETDKEKQMARTVCRKLGIPLHIITADVPALAAKNNDSMEATAREARYSIFEDVRLKTNADWIAVAHTADDQVEEFFLRLIRGAGLKGLAGMAPRRDKIIRPLLGETKQSLREYLESIQQDWCEDSSNLDNRYLRNRVRNQLLPLLEDQFNPSIRNTVLNTMQILRDEDIYLEQLTEEAFSMTVQQIVPENKLCTELYIDFEKLSAYPVPIVRRVIEKCFWQLRATPSFHHIEHIRELLERGICRHLLHLPQGVRSCFEGKLFHLFRPLPEGLLRGSRTDYLTPYCISIAGPGEYDTEQYRITLYYSDHSYEPPDRDIIRKRQGKQLEVDAAKVRFPMVLRPARHGERFHPCNRQGSKKIARFFNEKKIPADKRLLWPILTDDLGVIALAGVEIDHRCRVTQGTKRYLIITLEEL